MSGKKNDRCPNPMFIMWLEEWKTDAEKRGLNSKWTYTKAISSIKKYPLPLRSGKECKILENIGDGIAKKLDERLQQYIDDGGDVSLLHKVNKPGESSKPKMVKKPKPSALPTVDNHAHNNSTKQYICKYRSGAYALIVTLYKDQMDPSSVGHMMKEELQKNAQPLCDKSFTVPDGSSHYTSWSSMTTLINKGYVVKRSNPAQYSITDDGCELARRLLHSTGKLNENTSSWRENIIEKPARSPEKQEKLGVREPFLKPGAKITEGAAGVGDVNLLARIRKNGYRLEGTCLTEGRSADSDNECGQPISSEIGNKFSSECTLKENRQVVDSPVILPAISSSLKRNPESLPNEGRRKSQRLTPPLSVKGVQNSTSSSTTQSGTCSVSPLFTLLPGSFNVILCVDTSETAGAGKHKMDLLSTLYNSSITVESRKLQLGDFLWIAKEKGGLGRELVLDTIVERKRIDDLAGSIVDGRFREQKFRLKNCTLKNPVYLIERYGSVDHLPVPEATLRQAITNTQIIDNFFVKETADIYDSANYLTLLTSQLTTLYRNKTLHGLLMDRVRELKESKLHVEVVQSSEQYLISYEEFSTQTQKNKVLTVSEMFAKILMQVRGITTEKALAITDKFPTPMCLLKSYEGIVQEKDKLLSNVVFGGGKRKIGDALSKQIHTMFSKCSITD